MRFYFMWVLSSMVGSAAFQITLASGHLKNWYWLAPYLWAISGISFAIWAALNSSHFFGKGGQQLAPPTSASPVTQTQQIKNSGNSAITQNFYNVSLPVQTQPPPPAVTQDITEDKSSPLEFLEARSTRVYRDDHGKWTESDRAQCPALVADFQNPLSGRGLSNTVIGQVSAHLTYRSKGGKKLSITGTWIEEHLQVVDFPPGRTHCVLVAVKGKSGKYPCAMDNPNDSWAGIAHTRRGTIQLLESLEWPEPAKIPEDCSEIEIALAAGERRVTIFHEVFDFMLESDGTMRLERRVGASS